MIWNTQGPLLICAAVSTEKQRLSCHIWYELYQTETLLSLIWYEQHQTPIHIPNTTVSTEETWEDLTQLPKSTPLWKSCNTMLCSIVKVHCGVSAMECLLWTVESTHCGVSTVECGVHTVECLAVWARRALALSHCHHSIARTAAAWCTATTATAATYHCHHWHGTMPPLPLPLPPLAYHCYCKPLNEATAVYWSHITMHCCCEDV